MKKLWLCVGILVLAITLSLVIIISISKKDDKVVRIGALLPLTGQMAKYGHTCRNAIEMAVEEINSISTSSEIRIELAIEDDQMNPMSAVSAFKKLTEVNRTEIVIGPMASSLVLAVAPLAERNKVVLLSPGGSAPSISNAGDYIFRNCVSDLFEGSEMADFSYKKLNLRSCAVLYINNDFGKGLRGVFKDRFEALGGRIVIEEGFNEGGSDFRAQLTKLRVTNAAAVYLIGYNEMVVIFVQAKEIGYSPQWLATTMLNDSYLVEQTRGASDGCIFAAWDYIADSSSARVQGFVQRFKAKTGGQSPDVFAANSYDAVYILFEAAKRAKKGSITIKDALYGTQDFEGVTGRTSFDKNGDVTKPISVKKIEGGNIVDFSGR